MQQVCGTYIEPSMLLVYTKFKRAQYRCLTRWTRFQSSWPPLQLNETIEQPKGHTLGIYVEIRWIMLLYYSLSTLCCVIKLWVFQTKFAGGKNWLYKWYETAWSETKFFFAQTRSVNIDKLVSGERQTNCFAYDQKTNRTWNCWSSLTHVASWNTKWFRDQMKLLHFIMTNSFVYHVGVYETTRKS